MTDDELDIACTIARIEQVGSLTEGDGLREHIIDRLVTCDAPRLRRLLSIQALNELEEVQRRCS